MNLLELFDSQIIDLLGGIEKFKTYPIITNMENIPPKIGIGEINGLPIFTLTFRWRGNIYTEIFKQQSLNNHCIWECCTNKTYIFSQAEYNLLYPSDDIELNDITNIQQLVNNKTMVTIFNFTNEGSISASFFLDTAELI